MPSEALLSHPIALCNMVRRLAVEAGHATLDYFDEAGFENADRKKDGSPVTAADIAAEKIIESGLKDMLSNIPVVGEEAVSQGYIPDLSVSDYFWLVDPLDGTREFISGRGDYTVNIALIHKTVPVLGVVYAPVPGELYAGAGEGTAVRWMEDADKDKAIRVRNLLPEGLTVVASRNHGNDERLESFLSGYKIRKVTKRGSSLKICAVAAGKADLYPRFGPTCEWDTAAGDAVLRAAGGMMTDLNGQPLVYGRHDDKFLNPEFIASGVALAGSWLQTEDQL